MGTVLLAKVETIGEADMSCMVETTDVTYLVKDEGLADILNKHVGERSVFYIPPDDETNKRGIFRIAGWLAKSYVLIGEFTDREIQYIKTRCRSR